PPSHNAAALTVVSAGECASGDRDSWSLGYRRYRLPYAPASLTPEAPAAGDRGKSLGRLVLDDKSRWQPRVSRIAFPDEIERLIQCFDKQILTIRRAILFD